MSRKRIVEYKGGESRYGNYACDYLLAPETDTEEEVYIEGYFDQPYEELLEYFLEEARSLGYKESDFKFPY